MCQTKTGKYAVNIHNEGAGKCYKLAKKPTNDEEINSLVIYRTTKLEDNIRKLMK